MNLREELAAACLAHDADGDLEWARDFVARLKNAEHCGDCINVPMSCSRCSIDDAFALADSILPIVERAVAAERERCVGVASLFASANAVTVQSGDGFYVTADAQATANPIAAAIRALPPPAGDR